MSTVSLKHRFLVSILYGCWINFTVIIISCRAAYSVDCLAPYGGPVIPGVAMGGASKEKNYLDATGVTLTFINANDKDKSQLKDTFAWEKK